MQFWTFLAPFWGHCAKISNSKKWSFLLIFPGFTVFLPKKQRVSVCESFLGRFGPYFRVTPPGGPFRVPVWSNSNFWFFPGHCAAVTFPILVQNDLFRLIFTIFDLSRPLEGSLAHYLRVRARYGCRGVCGGFGLA